jgi:hypothetical protein
MRYQILVLLCLITNCEAFEETPDYWIAVFNDVPPVNCKNTLNNTFVFSTGFSEKAVLLLPQHNEWYLCWGRQAEGYAELCYDTVPKLPIAQDNYTSVLLVIRNGIISVSSITGQGDLVGYFYGQASFDGNYKPIELSNTFDCTVNCISNTTNPYFTSCDGYCTIYPIRANVPGDLSVGDLLFPPGTDWIDINWPPELCGGADLNGDNVVNLNDLVLLAAFWRSTSCADLVNCNGADLYPIQIPDRDVDLKDLDVLADNWLHTGCQY